MHDKKLHGTDHQLNKDRCPRDHLYAGPNLIATMSNRTITGPGPSRHCRACKNTNNQLGEMRKRGLPLPDFDTLADEKYAEIMAGFKDGTRCKRRHLLSGPNLRIQKRKRGDERICLSCRRANSLTAEARKYGRPLPDWDAAADAHYAKIMADYVDPVPVPRAESLTDVPQHR
jgi:hypothetical protein